MEDQKKLTDQAVALLPNYTPSTNPPQSTKYKPPNPFVGMSNSDAVGSSWGHPSKINRTTTAAGVSEQWVYDEVGYLYFKNGKLTAIQDQR